MLDPSRHCYYYRYRYDCYHYYYNHYSHYDCFRAHAHTYTHRYKQVVFCCRVANITAQSSSSHLEEGDLLIDWQSVRTRRS